MPSAQSLAYATLPTFRPVAPEEVLLPGEVKGHGHPVTVDDVSVDFFPTFSIPVLAGRGFQDSDISKTGSAQVSVVSQAFVKFVWRRLGDPIGKTVAAPNG